MSSWNCFWTSGTVSSWLPQYSRRKQLQQFVLARMTLSADLSTKHGFWGPQCWFGIQRKSARISQTSSSASQCQVWSLWYYQSSTYKTHFAKRTAPRIFWHLECELDWTLRPLPSVIAACLSNDYQSFPWPVWSCNPCCRACAHTCPDWTTSAQDHWCA